MLYRGLKVWQIYGANTDVGKTIASTLLCRALQRRASRDGVFYLKPVSTGPQSDADDSHIAKYVSGVSSKCLMQFSLPLSPHIAARQDSATQVGVFHWRGLRFLTFTGTDCGQQYHSQDQTRAERSGCSRKSVRSTRNRWRRVVSWTFWHCPSRSLQTIAPTHYPCR